MKIVSVVGARPQFVKLAPLSRRIRRYAEEIVVHTGQHYAREMSADFFADLEMPAPDVNLGVGSLGHGSQTGAMLAGLEPVLIEHRPDAVVVFGDTNSTLAGALAAAKLGIPTIHVEAGLRSFNRSMPEEINRVLTDHAAHLLFAPTRSAVDNLRREGLLDRTCFTGDIMVDALEEHLHAATSAPRVRSRLCLLTGEYVLVTLHRPFNVDDPDYLALILSRLATVGLPIVFPVHPRTKAVLDGARFRVPTCVRLLPPQGYLDFLDLQANALRIVTDSGGVQKEAYLLGVPCITLRPETEWPETVEAGWNLLADPRDPGLGRTVADFSPARERLSLFGRNVATRMVDLIRNGRPAGRIAWAEAPVETARSGTA